MAGSNFGQLLKLSTFGESHGPAIGGVIDGFPPGISIDIAQVQHQLRRRRPGQSAITTDRNEEDEVEILSGIYEQKSTGTPIAFLIRNKDKKSSDYDHLKSVYRPSHADYTYEMKYGIRDHRGGGRSSARETAARVAAGSIIAQWLNSNGIEISAYVSRVGSIGMKDDFVFYDEATIDQNVVRCPDTSSAREMISLIAKLKEEGDSVGGIITCVIKGCPAGLGEPVFDKLHADLGKAMLSINAVKGFEIGSGFSGALMLGSQHNDAFVKEGGQVKTLSNHSGGIQGGISNGMDIVFHTAFKPVATIKKVQQTVDDSGGQILLEAKGRHDPCVVPRAVPIVASMAALVIGDHLLRQSAIR
ncbi:MAG: chorismate synthase [Flavobacteriales bacterium]